MILGAGRRVRRLLSQADRARDRRDWDEAATFYGKAIATGPVRIGIRIQHGHALKEAGRLEQAEAAYRSAAELDAASGDALLHLGHALKLQDRLPDAIVAYAEALRIDSGLDSARAELMHLGARDALPEFGKAGLRRARLMANAGRSMEMLEHSLRRLARELPRSVADYQSFRADYPIEPPLAKEQERIHVLVDARWSTPAQLRATLLSLVDQATTDWAATVVAPSMLDHPVASLAAIDPRFVLLDAWPARLDGTEPFVLLVGAGAVLDPQALRWFGVVVEYEGLVGAYADHDAIRPDWRFGATRGAPSFFSMFDRFFFTACDEPPLTILARRSLLLDRQPATADGADAFRRAVLLAAGETGPVAHVPRVLSSQIVLPRSVLEGEDDTRPMAVSVPIAECASLSSAGLTVIIPTRDLPDMLERCVESLLAKADRPDRLDIIIVDNRSHEGKTATLLDRFEQQGKVRRLLFDEPFNWSRANNRAVAVANGDRLCFVNNDTEMLTNGWDVLLHAALEDSSVGAVGARLLYPDRTVQHAGVLFGTGQGSPVHEGVGTASDEGGPLERWLVRRQVPAVTGAFLCCTREAFAAVGGFEEKTLPIGFNDIDFCLRLRSLGLAILYEPAIQLVHLESKTRGANSTLSAREWDHAELESFHARWGEEMFVDPGYNPHWATAGKPFDGLQEPSRSMIRSYIDRSARRDPWRIISPAG